MPYLNLDLDYFDHPKTRRLVGLLGDGAALFPIRLWCYCGKYHLSNGILTGYSEKEIESIAGWKGEDGAMVRAMLTVRLIEKDEKNNFRVHDWKTINGHLLMLQKRAKHAAITRWKHATSNAKGMFVESPSQPAKPAILSKPSIQEKKQEARPSSLSDVVEFFVAKGKTERDAEMFWNHFEGNGWKVGGKAPMRKWKATASNWIAREWENTNGANRQGGRVSSPEQPKRYQIITR